MKYQVTRSAVLVAVLLQSLAAARAQEANTPVYSEVSDEVVVLSPFRVDSTQDSGYRASNSVSGSRLNTPIKDLPFAITAFTNEFIQDQHASGIFDIVKYAPGVTFVGGGFDEGDSHLSIRGFDAGPRPLRNGFSGPPVIDPTNIDRVEVVKGPASFLYGQLSPGGLVNVITKQPRTFKESTLRVGMGSDDYYTAALDSTGPVPGVSNLFYRIGVSSGQDSHYYDAYDANRWSFSGSLLWHVNKTGQILVSYEKLQKNEGPLLNPKPSSYDTRLPAGMQQGGIYPGLPQSFNSSAYSDFRDSDSGNFVAEYDQGLGEHWNIRAAAATSTRSIEFFTNGRFVVGYGIAGTTADIPATATLPAFSPVSGLVRRPNINHFWGDTQAYNFEAVGKYQLGAVSARLLLGWQYEKQSSDNKKNRAPTSQYPRPWDLNNPATWDRTEPFPADMPLLSWYHDEVVIKSYWAGLTLGFFNDRLLSLTGLRHSYNRTISSWAPTGEAFPPYASAANTPQAGLLYKLTDEVSAYVAYSRSFVPNDSDLYDADGNYVGPAKSPEGEGYEMGFKAASHDGRISGTVSIYQIRNKNLLQAVAAFDSNGELSFATVQTGVQQSRGVELDVVLSPIPNWQTYLSYSHQNPIYYKNPEDISLEGIPLLNSVRDSASIWSKYKFTQGALKKAYIAGGATWQGFQKMSDGNHSLYFRPYALFDLTVGCRAKLFRRDVDISLAVKNLENKEYFPSTNTRGTPRTFILSFVTKL